MSMISESEKQRRRLINESVVGTHIMEGLPPDQETRTLLLKYEEGDLTAEQLSVALHAHAMSLVEEHRVVGVA
jgi:hypothetical protein